MMAHALCISCDSMSYNTYGTAYSTNVLPSSLTLTPDFLVSPLPSSSTSMTSQLAVVVVVAVVAVAVIREIVSLARPVVAVKVAVVESLISRTTTTSPLYDEFGST